MVRRVPLKRNRRNSARNQAWASMRVMRRFNAPDIQTTAGLARSNARKYIAALVRHGYLRLLSKTRFEAGSYNTYLLVRDTGPKAPILRSDGSLFDPNMGVVAGE